MAFAKSFAKVAGSFRLKRRNWLWLHWERTPISEVKLGSGTVGAGGSRRHFLTNRWGRRAFARYMQSIPGVGGQAAIRWESVTKWPAPSRNDEEKGSSWREAVIRSAWSSSLFS